MDYPMDYDENHESFHFDLPTLFMWIHREEMKQIIQEERRMVAERQQNHQKVVDFPDSNR